MEEAVNGGRVAGERRAAFPEKSDERGGKKERIVPRRMRKRS